MLPSREFRFLSYVLGNMAPFLCCSENLAHATLEVVNGFPRQPVAEFSAEEALQLFSREFTKPSLAKSWIEMHVEHVPIVLLSCVFQHWQDHRVQSFLTKSPNVRTDCGRALPLLIDPNL